MLQNSHFSIRWNKKYFSELFPANLFKVQWHLCLFFWWGLTLWAVRPEHPFPVRQRDFFPLGFKLYCLLIKAANGGGGNRTRQTWHMWAHTQNALCNTTFLRECRRVKLGVRVLPPAVSLKRTGLLLFAHRTRHHTADQFDPDSQQRRLQMTSGKGNSTGRLLFSLRSAYQDAGVAQNNSELSDSRMEGRAGARRR